MFKYIKYKDQACPAPKINWIFLKVNKFLFFAGELMKQLQQEAFFVPLWISDAEIKAPPLCGAVPCHPDHVCEAGHRVAARIKSGMNADDWIVAEVTIVWFFIFLKYVKLIEV